MACFARLLQALPIRRKLRNIATELLPTLHSDIDVPAIDVDAVADTLARLGGHQALEHQRASRQNYEGPWTAPPAGTPANPEQPNAAMQALFVNPLGDYEGRSATL